MEIALTWLDRAAIGSSRRVGFAKTAATLHDLAGEFGVSAERIRQIESQAIENSRPDGIRRLNVETVIREKAPQKRGFFFGSAQDCFNSKSMSCAKMSAPRP
jgi:hypothetical protein